MLLWIHLHCAGVSATLLSAGILPSLISPIVSIVFEFTAIYRLARRTGGNEASRDIIYFVNLCGNPALAGGRAASPVLRPKV